MAKPNEFFPEDFTPNGALIVEPCSRACQIDQICRNLPIDM